MSNDLPPLLPQTGPRFDIEGYLRLLVNCNNPAPCPMCYRASAIILNEWNKLAWSAQAPETPEK